MAEALARGVLRARTLPASSITASDPDPARRAAVASLGVRAVESNETVLAASDIVVLAVKPQVLDVVLRGLRPAARPGHLFISIAAGWPIRRLEAALPERSRVIRVMPNTPMQVGRGASALARGNFATAEDMEAARALFGSCGVTVELAEEALDAVTAVSGSGPAYVFFLAECMVEAGVAEGLEPGAALALAAATIEGAGALLGQSRERPEELRRRVTSPGGTTEAAFRELDAGRVRESLVRAIMRAAARSRELAGS